MLIPLPDWKRLSVRREEVRSSLLRDAQLLSRTLRFLKHQTR
jgi:hypothetical protein